MTSTKKQGEGDKLDKALYIKIRKGCIIIRSMCKGVDLWRAVYIKGRGRGTYEGEGGGHEPERLSPVWSLC